MWYMKKHLPVHTPVLAYFPSGQVSITQKSDCKYHSNLLFYCATQFISDISKIPLKWTPIRLWTMCVNIRCPWNYRPTSCYVSVFITAQWRYLPSWHWYNSLRITYIRYRVSEKTKQSITSTTTTSTICGSDCLYSVVYIFSMEYISKFVLPIHVFASRTFGEVHLVQVPSAALHSSQPATASEHTEIKI